MAVLVLAAAAVRLARQARQARPLHSVCFPQFLMQRRNSCKIFDPAGTLCHNEGKTWEFSSSQKGGFVQRLCKISLLHSPGKTIARWRLNRSGPGGSIRQSPPPAIRACCLTHG
jgi:hypothetical protein